MKNKQHKHILRAFISAKIPNAIYNEEFITLDSALSGYCYQALRYKRVNLATTEIITDRNKQSFSKLINQLEGEMKRELVIYYRLAVLAEAVVFEYAAT
jgi:hypothetical protein